MNKCEHCSGKVSVGSSFCSHCGAALTSTELHSTKHKASADVPSLITKIPNWLACTLLALVFALIMVVASQPWKSANDRSTTRTPTSIPSRITSVPTTTSLPEPSSKALEGSGVAIQRTFSGPDLDFLFEYSSSQDGTSIITGRSPDGSTSVIIFGNSSNPASVTLLLSLPENEDEDWALLTMTTYLYAFVSTVAPDWQDGTEWVSKTMTDLVASEQNEAETWISGLHVSVGFIHVAGTFSVTFSAD